MRLQLQLRLVIMQKLEGIILPAEEEATQHKTRCSMLTIMEGKIPTTDHPKAMELPIIIAIPHKVRIKVRGI